MQVERGGEITYHGPGQVVLYTLVDLARRGIKVKQFVAMLEQSVIDLLGGRAREASPARPGIYVDGAKVAALGIRVSRGCAFHGLALNVDMDLAPFAAIDPCGYPGPAGDADARPGNSRGRRDAGRKACRHSSREARACVKPASRKRAR